GQRHDVTLEPGGVIGQFELRINLVKVRTDAQQNPAVADRSKVAFLEPVAGMEQVLHAIGLGQELAAIESINKQLACGGLEANEKMPWHADACNRQTQPF